MKYLNLGCGSRFQQGWVNVDFRARPPHVLGHDLSRDLPFESAVFDVVYHSHVLEHLKKKQAPRFINECFRVMKSGGILRVVVPDLEGITKEYLAALVRAEANAPDSPADYEWMMLEMYDQTVRDHPGGEMLDFLRHSPVRNEAFVVRRCGSEVRRIIELGVAEDEEVETPMGRREQLRRGFGKFLSLDRVRSLLRESLLKVLLGQEYHALQMGRFRMVGEIHQWMYDRFSLSQMIKESGFMGVVVRDAFTSYLSDWDTFCLDSEIDGTVYKPDSLYIEGLKP